MLDLPKKSRKSSDIAGQFRELQQLRNQVHEAELEFSRNRSHRGNIDSTVDDKDRDRKIRGSASAPD